MVLEFGEFWARLVVLWYVLYFVGGSIISEHMKQMRSQVMIDEEGKLLRKVYVTHSATASFFNSFNSIFLPLAALNE